MTSLSSAAEWRGDGRVLAVNRSARVPPRTRPSLVSSAINAHAARRVRSCSNVCPHLPHTPRTTHCTLSHHPTAHSDPIPSNPQLATSGRSCRSRRSPYSTAATIPGPIVIVEPTRYPTPPLEILTSSVHIRWSRTRSCHPIFTQHDSDPHSASRVCRAANTMASKFDELPSSTKSPTPLPTPRARTPPPLREQFAAHDRETRK